MKATSLFSSIAVIGVLASFAFPSAAQPMSYDVVGDEGEGGEEPQEPDCPDTGAEWVEKRVTDSGGLGCPGTEFKITVGVAQGGGTITYTFNGCPSFIETEPAHGKHVEKDDFMATSLQKIPRKIQNYKADCGGWFSSASCLPDGPPTDSPITVDHWQDMACSDA